MQTTKTEKKKVKFGEDTILKYQAGENIQREGSEQQASKSVCHSAC